LYSRHEHAIDEGNERTQVDHVRDYKQPGGKKGEDGVFVPPEAPSMNAMPRVIGEGVSKVSAFPFFIGFLTFHHAASTGSAGSGSESGDSVDDEDPMAEYLRAQRKASGSSSKKKRKHEGESKEERRARKEAKRAKKAAKSQKEKDDYAHRVKKETGREKNEYDGLAEQFGREDSSKARSRDRYEGDHARNRRGHDGSKQHAEDDRDRRATSTRALQEHERGGDRERDRDSLARQYNRSPDRRRERPYDDDSSRDVRSRINERMYV
jgi:RNA-binding motif X-linked protein 2